MKLFIMTGGMSLTQNRIVLKDFVKLNQKFYQESHFVIIILIKNALNICRLILLKDGFNRFNLSIDQTDKY
jgi:hypothetical protein